MPENLPRPLVVIAGIVAIVAIVVGVRDYVRQKDVTPSANTSAATVAPPDVKDVPKKASPSKTRRTRMSAREAIAPTQRPAAAQGKGKPLTSEVFADADVKPTIESADLLGAGAARSPNDKVKTGVQQINLASDTECLPLPNVTHRGDADAGYYQNWAREYRCFY